MSSLSCDIHVRLATAQMQKRLYLNLYLFAMFCVRNLRFLKKHLHQRVDHFIEAMKQKNQAKGSVDTGAVKRLRVEHETACKDLVVKLNALMLLHSSESWKALENNINALNDVRRAINKAKRTSKSNAGDK